MSVLVKCEWKQNFITWATRAFIISFVLNKLPFAESGCRVGMRHFICNISIPSNDFTRLFNSHFTDEQPEVQT